MIRIVVCLRYERNVGYEVAIDEPFDIEKVKEMLRAKQADDWIDDPNLYEDLGSEFQSMVEALKNSNIKVQKEGGIMFISCKRQPS